MCGLIYVRRLDGKRAYKAVIKQYHKQKARGSQGFGFIAINGDGRIEAVERATSEKDIIARLETMKAPEIFFHHRLPTSTPNFVQSAHPILVSNKKLKHDYYVMHNGVISNEWELYEKHTKQGYRYTTELCKKWVARGADGKGRSEVESYSYINDSEAFAVEIAQVLDGKKETQDAKGSIAFFAVEVNPRNGRVTARHFGRGFNPLIAHRTKERVLIASEAPLGVSFTCNEVVTKRIDREGHELVSKSDITLANYDASNYTYSGSTYQTRAGFTTPTQGLLPAGNVSGMTMDELREEARREQQAARQPVDGIPDDLLERISDLEELQDDALEQGDRERLDDIERRLSKLYAELDAYGIPTIANG